MWTNVNDIKPVMLEISREQAKQIWPDRCACPPATTPVGLLGERLGVCASCGCKIYDPTLTGNPLFTGAIGYRSGVILHEDKRR